MSDESSVKSDFSYVSETGSEKSDHKGKVTKSSSEASSLKSLEEIKQDKTKQDKPKSKTNVTGKAKKHPKRQQPTDLKDELVRIRATSPPTIQEVDLESTLSKRNKPRAKIKNDRRDTQSQSTYFSVDTGCITMPCIASKHFTKWNEKVKCNCNTCKLQRMQKKGFVTEIETSKKGRSRSRTYSATSFYSARSTADLSKVKKTVGCDCIMCFFLPEKTQKRDLISGIKTPVSGIKTSVSGIKTLDSEKSNKVTKNVICNCITCYLIPPKTQKNDSVIETKQSNFEAIVDEPENDGTVRKGSETTSYFSIDSGENDDFQFNPDSTEDFHSQTEETPTRVKSKTSRKRWKEVATKVRSKTSRKSLKDAATTASRKSLNVVKDVKCTRTMKLFHKLSMCHGKVETEYTFVDPATGEARRTWAGRWDFVLAVLGYSFGDGAMVRFPLFMSCSGGIAVLLPYTIMMVTFGTSLIFMEMALGQFCSRGVLSCWQFARMFTGVGCAMFGGTIFMSMTTMRNELDYVDLLVKSLRGEEYLHIPSSNIHSEHMRTDNETICEKVFGRPYSVKGFGDWVDLSEGFRQSINSEVLLYNCILCLSFILILLLPMYVFGRVLAILTLLPYLFLCVIFLHVSGLPGAQDGISHYLSPNFSKLNSLHVWMDAAQMTFYAMGPAYGVLLTAGSYNSFHHNVVQSACVVSCIDLLARVCSGCVLFASLGHLSFTCGFSSAHFHDLTESYNKAVSGQVVSFSLQSNPQAWVALFCVTRIFANHGIIVLSLDHLVTSVTDSLGLVTWWRRVVAPVVCLGFCLFMFPFCAPSGEKLQGVDFTIQPVLSLLLVLSVGWVYKVKRFVTEVEFMVGWDVSLLLSSNLKVHWGIMFKFIVPLSVIGCIILNYGFCGMKFWDYPVTLTVETAILSLIPGTCIVLILTSSGSLTQRVRDLLTPTADWGPALPQHRRLVNHIRFSEESLAAEKKRSLLKRFREDSFLRSLKCFYFGKDNQDIEVTSSPV